jgi:hypothetical protein
MQFLRSMQAKLNRRLRSGRRIRTLTGGAKTHCPAVKRSPNDLLPAR